MKPRRKKDTKKPAVSRGANQHLSQRDDCARVMRELEAVGKTCPDKDPLVEQLRKCPETFVAGEMLGKMFDSLKYNRANSENDERLIPPAGIVFPLV
jgi:hypothetical protein